MPGPERWVSVGRIARAHGVRGELAVRSEAPRESALLRVRKIRIGDAERELESARAANAEVLIRVRGVADRTAAEALKGQDVSVPRADLAPSEPGEYYFADLVGLMAHDEAGRELGQVKGLWETGPVPVVVIGEGERELLVPFAEDFIVAVKPEEGRLVVRPPEYSE